MSAMCHKQTFCAARRRKRSWPTWPPSHPRGASRGAQAYPSPPPLALLPSIEIFEQTIDLQNPDDDGLWYFPFIAAAYADPTVGRMDDPSVIGLSKIRFKDL